ncbi:hypothetical protein HDU86_003198 [Geranomyces michiganensis]|nr:hypothetical protein HDU86_003198 [Geranomyces michiganensis]
MAMAFSYIYVLNRPETCTYGKRVTLSELLNQLELDGIVNQNGRLTIMTINRVSVLDPALIPPRRIDFTL